MWFGVKSFLRLPLHWLCETGSPSGASFLRHVSCWKRRELLSSGLAEIVEVILFISLVLVKNKNFKKAEVAHSIQRKKTYFADQHDPNRKMKSQRDSNESFLIPQEYRSEKDFLICCVLLFATNYW